MIPQRVRLKGFLCYKEEQEVCFDGSSLWILAGLNGSGKSTVFDAITYALFGHHRGGSQDAQELINKDSDRAAVEFDFLLDGHSYQAYRTLQLTKQGKARSTLQIYRRLADGSKEAVTGTNLKAGFDAWVAENIGLSYETFTSSVLLLQGKADRLLDSTAKGRHEVLAGIVDLERFRRLHQKADDQRKEREGEVKRLHYQLDSLPEFSLAALAEAEEKIAAAESARQQAQAEVDRLQKLELQAGQWAELQGQLSAARQKWHQAQQLLADAPAIEQAVGRLKELREVLPRLETILQQRCHIRDSEDRTRELKGQQQKLQERLAHQDRALEQARDKRANLQAAIAEDEKKHRELATQLRQGGALLETLKEYERQEAVLARLQEELARLPADPTDNLRRTQEAHDRLAALGQVIPLLARFQTRRDELKQARQREEAAQKSQDSIKARGEQLGAEEIRLKPRVEEAARARQEADAEATRTGTLFDQARQMVDDLAKLHGAKVCRHCGQALTPQHLRDEKRRREKEAAEADRQYQQAAGVQQAAQKVERELRGKLEQLQKQLAEAREEFRDQRRQAEQARQDVERLQMECGQAYQELPESFRNLTHPAPAADWLETTYPAPADLAGLRRQAAGLPAARQALHEAGQVLGQWNTLKGHEASTRQSLQRLQGELPSDRGGLRREHVKREAEEQALDKNLRARRQEVQATQDELDRLAKEREQFQQQLTALQGKLHTEEMTRSLCKQSLERTQRDLPASWQALAEKAGLAEVHGLRSERDALEREQTDERGRQLQQARVSLEMLLQEKEKLEARQEKFPAEARQEPAQLRARIQEALLVRKTRDEELTNARHQKVQLESYRQQRARLEQDLLLADKELAQSKLLADLLGRDRLQLHLVRQAERQVVDYANAVLDRLSGGQLYLRLVGEAGGDGSAAKALELEAHNRGAGEKPINVAFLSGSQKFRVAVSLALGIGQYASRRHRPIESVIIDEGFGCLDKEGRQAMIQEMQNLRDQLKCILLVSHQEEFADAFNDGYYFELKEKTTRATRFQR